MRFRAPRADQKNDELPLSAMKGLVTIYRPPITKDFNVSLADWASAMYV